MRSLALLLLVSAGTLMIRAAEPATPLDRLLAAATKSPEWTGAKDQAARLQVLRRQALRYAAVSDLASDRYLITTLAGPVDLVRFFHLAKTVGGGAMERRAALLHQWKRENGAALKPGGNAPGDAELSPDDLPSNALGALFGEEVKPHNRDLGYDLEGALRKFFASLEPVPDAVTTKHPYRQLVLGLPENPTPDASRAARAWVTAEPLYLVPTVAPDKAGSLRNAAAALKAAGLEVREHGGERIVIDRLGTPDPSAQQQQQTLAKAEPPQKEPDTAIGHLFMRPPQGNLPMPDAPEPGAPVKAVPVEEYPKAVPVPEKAVKKPAAKKPAAKKAAYPKAVPVE